jgi:glutamine synthetase adenylyltransferase
MALVKARTLGRMTPLSRRIDEEIEKILGAPRDFVGLSADVEDMRQRLIASKPARDKWDLKRAKGGFTEIDFTVEYLTLRHAPAGFVATPSLTSSLSSLFRSGHLTEIQFRTLSSADELFETIFQIGRAATGVGFSPDDAGAALADRVLEATLSPSLDALACRIREAQDAVLNVYSATVTGEPDG